MAKSTSYGRKEQESAWKNTEVDALYQLVAAGVRVPQPFGFFSGVLLMELVTDAEGHSAPRLGEVDLAPEQAREFHAFLIRQVVRMLCVGLIHGDLSEFNVLVGKDGPVIAAANNNALAMLQRDVGNITETLGRFAPELLETDYANEMWALFEQGLLLPETPLTGVFVKDESETNVDEIVMAIDEAREEAIRRELARTAALEPDND